MYIAMAKSHPATPTDVIPIRGRGEPASPPTWIKPQLAKLVAPTSEDLHCAGVEPGVHSIAIEFDLVR